MASWASSPAVRKVMQANRSAGTGPERVLRAALRRLGLRGRPNYVRAAGWPDVAWPRRKVAVFVDGDFWHGRRPAPRTHRAFWLAKFARNRARDRYVTRRLQRDGWLVIRFWERDVLAAPDDCARRIARWLMTR